MTKSPLSSWGITLLSGLQLRCIIKTVFLTNLVLFWFPSIAFAQYGERGDYGGDGGGSFLGLLVVASPLLVFIYTTMSLDPDGGEFFSYLCWGILLAFGLLFIGIPPWVAYVLVQGHIIYRLKTE